MMARAESKEGVAKKQSPQSRGDTAGEKNGFPQCEQKGGRIQKIRLVQRGQNPSPPHCKSPAKFSSFSVSPHCTHWGGKTTCTTAESAYRMAPDVLTRMDRTPISLGDEMHMALRIQGFTPAALAAIVVAEHRAIIGCQQIRNPKHEMVRPAHHPEQSRRAISNDQNPDIQNC